MKKINRIGKKYNRLTVIREGEKRGVRNSITWVCVCDCGNEHTVLAGDLTSGRVNQCRECGIKQLSQSLIKKNNYKIVDDIAIVDISTPKYKNINMVIDKEDIKHLTQKVYVGSSRGMAYAFIGRNKPFHSLLIDCKKGQQIDHKDGDSLNNKKNNLRIANQAENCKNLSKYSSNTSGQTGVSFHKRINKWQSRIKVNKKDIHLGYFDNIDEAIITRKEAEKKYNYYQNHGRKRIKYI